MDNQDYIEQLRGAMNGLLTAISEQQKTIQYQCRVPIELFENVVDEYEHIINVEFAQIYGLLSEIQKTNPYLRATKESLDRGIEKRKSDKQAKFVLIVADMLLKGEADSKNRLDLGVVCGRVGATRNTIRAYLKQIRAYPTGLAPIVRFWVQQDEHFYNTQ